jgi:hypothetical protein
MDSEWIVSYNVLIHMIIIYYITKMTLLNTIIIILLVINEVLIYTIIKILVYDSCAQRHQNRINRKG